MKFAENNRISQRQLYRQIVIAFIAPFLLCLFGKRQTLGLSGLAGTVLALVVVLFYVIFLIRLRHAFANPCRTAGEIWGRLAGIFFLIYCILGAAFLLDLLGEIVAVSLGTGIAKGWLCLVALVVCSLGTHRGIQRRGRMGEVSGGVVLAAVIFMLLLSVGQGKWEYLQEMVWNSSFSGQKILTSGYGVICAFSGLGLLPFALEHVERNKNGIRTRNDDFKGESFQESNSKDGIERKWNKMDGSDVGEKKDKRRKGEENWVAHRSKAGTGKTVSLAVVTLGGLLILTELLLPAVFGWGRLKYENYPVLPLLAGADLPGNVLARFDVLWMGFLLYSLLFSIGSLLHYGHLIVEKVGLGTGRLWIPVLVVAGIVAEVGTLGIGEYFPLYLQYIFVPAMLVIQIVFFIVGKKKWKKKQAKGKADSDEMIAARKKNASAEIADPKLKNLQDVKNNNRKNKGCWGRKGIVTFVCASAILWLTGCGGVEPEKRMYPLALGADYSDGKFELTYGIPDLPKSTGQEKNGEDQGNSAPAIWGETFSEIESLYSRTQQKYLDMGHLQVLVMGQDLLDSSHWRQVLEYLKQEPTIGENVYVFRCENAAEAVGWVSPQETSLGEYLLGLLENTPDGGPAQAVTLREVYHEFYDRGALPVLPELKIGDGELEVQF